jgi:trehalose 6-phosphate synthase/phosphatase
MQHQSLANPAMAGNERPGVYRQDTDLPVRNIDNFGVPVTPTISNEDKRSSFSFANPPTHVLEAIGAQGPNREFESANGEALLRRLSLKPDANSSDFDPHAAHPSLGLSGNVISAAFCVPYKIGYTTTGEWVGCM